jgi:hypothetical protein
MSRIKTTIMKRSVLLLVFMLLAPSLAGAFNYPQPAYISSFYLCNKLIKKGNTLQPDKIFNALSAVNRNEAVYLVIDIVGNKGVHIPEIEILDKNGKLYSNIIKLDPVTIRDDGDFFRVMPRITGRFPEGGVFFKILDTLDSGSRTMLGMFGVKTVK